MAASRKAKLQKPTPVLLISTRKGRRKIKPWIKAVRADNDKVLFIHSFFSFCCISAHHVQPSMHPVTTTAGDTSSATISLVITTYNRPDALNAVVEACFAQ